MKEHRTLHHFAHLSAKQPMALEILGLTGEVALPLQFPSDQLRETPIDSSNRHERGPCALGAGLKKHQDGLARCFKPSREYETETHYERNELR